MNEAEWLRLFGAMAGSSGVVGAIVALIKFKGENASVLIGAAGSVVGLQEGVITQLRADVVKHINSLAVLTEQRDTFREELADVRLELARAQQQLKKLDAIRQQRDTALTRIDQLNAEKQELRAEITRLQEEVRRLGGTV